MRHWFTLARAFFITAITLAATEAAFAQVVILDDGFPLHGKVKREMEVMIDPATGQPIPIVKNSPCFLVDDRARYVVFGQKRAAQIPPEGIDFNDGQVMLTMPFARSAGRRRPTAAEIGQPSPFNDKWERTVPVVVLLNAPTLIPGQDQVVRNKSVIKQKITILTPYFMRLETVEFDWTQNYLTNEFGPQVVLPLVRAHPEVAGKAGTPPDFERRFRVFRFCTQAGWLNEARAELEGLKREFPGEKQRLEQAETGLRQSMQRKLWEEIGIAHRAGRHAFATDLLTKLTISDLPARTQAEATSLRANYDDMAQRLTAARRALALCYGDRVGPPAPILGDIGSTIATELNFDTLDRLKDFIALGKQMESELKSGREPRYTFEQLLAFAGTAWVMGPDSAEASVTAAERLWAVRDRLFALQRAHAAGDRARLAGEIAESSGLKPQEVARMITMLPPVDGEDWNNPIYAAPVDRKTKNPWSDFPPYPYKLLLPPEYHPHRAWPLLVILPNATESTADALQRWASAAARHGYVLASVDWGTAKTRYEYLPEEHAAALECVRDVKRYAQIDSDRVFLTGFSEGANAAIDVGLSHPDQFAGVIPINGRPRWYASQWYWRNAQVTPFYFVIGEYTNDIRNWVTNIYQRLAEKGFPSLLTFYKGRTTEFFPAEVANAFTWMDLQHRATGFPELGRYPRQGYNGQEYQTFRTTDDRFFWLSTEAIGDKYLLPDFMATTSQKTPAALYAKIGDNNQIVVYTRGVKQVSVWLGRAYDPRTGTRDMIDFQKPVKITVNGTKTFTNNNQPLQLRLETLLEDFYRRNDRQRLYFARVDFDKLQ